MLLSNCGHASVGESAYLRTVETFTPVTVSALKNNVCDHAKTPYHFGNSSTDDMGEAVSSRLILRTRNAGYAFAHGFRGSGHVRLFAKPAAKLVNIGDGVAAPSV